MFISSLTTFNLNYFSFYFKLDPKREDLRELTQAVLKDRYIKNVKRRPQKGETASTSSKSESTNSQLTATSKTVSKTGPLSSNSTSSNSSRTTRTPQSSPGSERGDNPLTPPTTPLQQLQQQQQQQQQQQHVVSPLVQYDYPPAPQPPPQYPASESLQYWAANHVHHQQRIFGCESPNGSTVQVESTPSPHSSPMDPEDYQQQQQQSSYYNIYYHQQHFNYGNNASNTSTSTAEQPMVNGWDAV